MAILIPRGVNLLRSNNLARRNRDKRFQFAQKVVNQYLLVADTESLLLFLKQVLSARWAFLTSLKHRMRLVWTTVLTYVSLSCIRLDSIRWLRICFPT